MFKLVRRIKDHFARERARHEKLRLLFQPGQRIRSLASGTVYVVEWVTLGGAFLRSSTGRQLLIDTWTPAGTVRTKVADSWELA